MNKTSVFALRTFVAQCIGIRITRRRPALFACTILLAGVAAAQVGSASIHGTVTDLSGAILVGATVTIKNVTVIILSTSAALRNCSVFGSYSRFCIGIELALS